MKNHWQSKVAFSVSVFVAAHSHFFIANLFVSHSLSKIQTKNNKTKLKTTKQYKKLKIKIKTLTLKHYEGFSDSLISFNLLLLSKQFH